MTTIIDVLAVLIILGLVLGGAGLVLHFRNKNPKLNVMRQGKRMQSQGEINVLRVAQDRERLCSECQKLTSPSQDMFLNDGWIHTLCYLNTKKIDQAAKESV